MTSQRSALLLFILGSLSLAQAAASNMQLQLVQIVTRHGDRTATDEISQYPVQWSCHQNVLTAPGVGNALEIDTPPTVFRTMWIPNRQTLKGNCTLGQLTRIGASQHYTLGKQLRARYVTSQQPFLNDSLDVSQVYVRSTYHDRCFQSAQALLGGMFSMSPASSEVAAFPIFTIENDLENMALNFKLCPKLAEFVTYDLLSNHSVYYNNLVQILAPIEADMIEIFGTANPLALLAAYDNLNCRYAHNLPMPPKFTPFMFSVLREATWYFGSVLFNSTYSLGIGTFIEELIEGIEGNLAGQASPMFALYSGHDSSVGPLLSAFGLYNGTWPPYAANLIFETYQSTVNGNYYTRLIYNQEPVIIPDCGQEYCPLNTFLKLAKATVPPNFTKQCQATGFDGVLSPIAKAILK